MPFFRSGMKFRSEQILELCSSGSKFYQKIDSLLFINHSSPFPEKKKNNVFSLSKSMLQRPKKTKIEIKHSNIFTKPLWGGLTLTVPFPQSPQRSFSSVPSICKYHICLLPNDPIKHYYINKRQCQALVISWSRAQYDKYFRVLAHSLQFISRAFRRVK